MRRRAVRHPFPAIAAAVLALAVVVAGVTACGGADVGTSPSASPPSSSGPSLSGPAAGTKMAPGLYDLDDGRVMAVGTVEHSGLEGGFWAVVGGTEADGNEGELVAVIANGEQFAQQFETNEGLSFEVYGTRAGEASIRMAGPEIVADRVVLAAEGGPAE